MDYGDIRDGNFLRLERCPHCGIADPSLTLKFQETTNGMGGMQWLWATFVCGSCGSFVTAKSPNAKANPVLEVHPAPDAVDEAITGRVGDYLSQAINSKHAPALAVIGCGSAVDAMLKDRGYKRGSLYGRIDKAAKKHLITAEMATWAHEVRFGSNEQRHADENAELPTTDDAERSITFAKALAQYLIVLPALVAGRAKPPPSAAADGAPPEPSS